MTNQTPFYNPFGDVRKSEFQVNFEIIDPVAKENAELSSSATFSGSVAELQDNINHAKGQATLEHNMWVLDSSRTVALTGESVGWWSEAASDGMAEYSETPYISVYFGGHAVSTVGITVNFDMVAGIFPTGVRIIAYDERGAIMHSQVFENKSAEGVFDFRCEDYYYLTIIFLSSQFPGYRVRVNEVAFGIVKRYDADTIEKLRLVHSASFNAETLPSAQLELTVDNTDRAYDLLSPQNIFAYLEQGVQPIIMRAFIDGEPVNMGQLYYTSAKVSSDGMTATITANDKILQLDSATYTGYSGYDTLAYVVSKVLDGIDLPVEYDNYTASTLVNTCIPENTKKREAIRLLAQAARCSCWITRQGVLHFGQINAADQPVQTITDDELYNFNGISISPYVGRVQLNVRDSFAGTEQVFYSGDGASVKTINNPCAYDGQAVADWLYWSYQRRRRYSVSNQGDPALEIGDTVKIYDAYNQNLNAAMTGFDLTYDGALSIVTSAVGEGHGA